MPAPPEATDVLLREDIRRLGALLGETIVRHEGPALLELVESVRVGTREDPGAAAALIEGLDLETATRLARAFSIYFDLANVAEQVQRARDIQARRREGENLIIAVAERAARQPDAAPRGELLAQRMSVRPVFTAHPTEAARRSVLTKQRRIADLLLDDRLAADDKWLRVAALVEIGRAHV